MSYLTGSEILHKPYLIPTDFINMVFSEKLQAYDANTLTKIKTNPVLHYIFLYLKGYLRKYEVFVRERVVSCENEEELFPFALKLPLNLINILQNKPISYEDNCIRQKYLLNNFKELKDVHKILLGKICEIDKLQTMNPSQLNWSYVEYYNNLQIDDIDNENEKSDVFNIMVKGKRKKENLLLERVINELKKYRYDYSLVNNTSFFNPNPNELNNENKLKPTPTTKLAKVNEPSKLNNIDPKVFFEKATIGVNDRGKVYIWYNNSREVTQENLHLRKGNFKYLKDFIERPNFKYQLPKYNALNYRTELNRLESIANGLMKFIEENFKCKITEWKSIFVLAENRKGTYKLNINISKSNKLKSTEAKNEKLKKLEQLVANVKKKNSIDEKQTEKLHDLIDVILANKIKTSEEIDNIITPIKAILSFYDDLENLQYGRGTESSHWEE